MAEPRVTIAIPTFERSALLRSSLASALAQDFADLRVVVLDNASSDDTEAVVRSLADERLRYVRNDTNVGMMGNLNRAIEINRSPFLGILLDDDVLLPEFVKEGVALLEAHPTVGLCFSLARYIDARGRCLHLAEVDLPAGVVPGLEYLHMNAIRRRGGCLSSALMRASALAAAGPFDSPHTKHTIDLNLYLRLARHSDVGFVPKELAQVRLHPDQASEREWNAARLGYEAEYIDAVAYLLASPRAEEPAYREWLSDRLLELNARQSESIHPLVPGLHLDPEQRLATLSRELSACVPPGARYLLVDEQEWGADLLPGRQALPFLERSGCYWGPPPDAATAIRELERMRHAGARFIVFGWPAFWWLEYYAGLRRHLYEHYRTVLDNRRAVAFDLAESAGSA